MKPSEPQNTLSDKALLQINVLSNQDNYPISDALVTISDPEDANNIIEKIITNSSGQTGKIKVRAPAQELSCIPGKKQPYAKYTVNITATGYDPLIILGTEVLSGTLSLQNVFLHPIKDAGHDTSIIIPAHILYGNYPPKIAETEIKPTGSWVKNNLSKVVIPDTIIVHDGTPTDTIAKNYHVSYKEYIKNVASSEIYATWPESTIIAGILSIMSFTLNRVYTEWYRNQGLDFTVTSSTAFDHKWIYGRNIYHNISCIVDELFHSYLSRPEITQPILTQYCDGRKTNCPNWMSLWGAKNLGDQGHSPINILRNYYGETMYINKSEQISGIPSSWPGNNLTVGESGAKVEEMQKQLATIAVAYPIIPGINVDGIYGLDTAAAVKEFQNFFQLPVTDALDFTTWHKISHIYTSITRVIE